MECLERCGIDGKDQRLITNLYWNQTAKVRTGETLSEDIRIECGVRQGCIMSPTLFNRYTDDIFKVTADLPGIRIHGKNINNIRYADYTAILAGFAEELQQLVNAVRQAGEQLEMRLNVKKTKVMVMKTQNEEETIPITIKADDIKLEQVDRFLYLGQLITADGKCREEAIRRIGIAKSTFNKMDNIFKDRHLSMATKLRTLRCYVISTLLYASDTWTMTAEMEKRIESLELWFLRRIMKVIWTKKISNVKIRELIEQKGGRQLYLIKEIRKRKVEYCGHIMRKDGITKLTITGKGEGKKGPGRPRRTWLKDIQEWCTYPSNTALIREAENRQRWTKRLHTTPWMRDVT